MSAIPSVTFVVRTSAFIGSSLVFKFHSYADATELAANVMRSATSLGCETIAAWLNATLRISAPNALSHEFFRLWRNHLVVGCHHVPRWKSFPRRRPGLCGEGVDAQGFLHCSHDAGFRWIHIGGKCLCEAIPINPQKALIVRRANRGSTCWGWSLFAQTIQALAFVQGKGGDVYQRSYARHAVRSSGNYDASVGVTGKHDWALQHAEQVLRHRYVCLDRSERQLSRHDVQTI